MRCPYCIKICSKCHRLLVACSLNFAKQKKGKYGLKSQCKECRKKYNSEHKEHIAECRKKYNSEHKEHIAECRKKYNSEHKEHIAEYNKKFREANPEYHKQYYENNKDQYAEYAKQYNSEHKEHIAEYYKQWRENNRVRDNEIHLKAKHKRRAKLKSNGGEYTLEQWQECLEFFDYKCAYSGAELTKDNTNVEHIIPISKGGTNNIYNIVPALDTVNFSKKDKDMLEWYKEQPYYSEERLNKILDWIEYASSKYELNQ